MPTCFAPGCTSGYRTNPAKRHFFIPPSNQMLFSKWERAIHRADKKLSAKSAICDLHFKSHEVLKDYVHIINGKEVRTPRGRYQLTPDAVPSIFPGQPAYMSTREGPSPRRPPKTRRQLPSAPRKHKRVTEDPSINFGEIDEPDDDIPMQIDTLKDALMRTQDGWCIEIVKDGPLKCLAMFKFVIEESTIVVPKSIIFYESGHCVLTGKHIFTSRKEHTINTINEALALVTTLKKYVICKGTQDCSYDKNCDVLSEHDICKQCERLQKTLNNKQPGISSKERCLSRRLKRTKDAPHTS